MGKPNGLNSSDFTITEYCLHTANLWKRSWIKNCRFGGVVEPSDPGDNLGVDASHCGATRGTPAS